ncbi:hypothetical protein EHI8A_045700 [Entamoeba histolytica HM-1:IMSS-B]|uniref:Uncharacterized protein n=6 Tax=Entamoeba histolytica TaxID=5759 RepID=C4LYH3_ENTH1|nr:hypothetical protein EHI_093820 [Entamoeba histolytica HM-1:IMSS]EMD46598.1 Hypothetical protein EHI5A_068510 [Entamoeba histolytica KU27]EMH72713.1 hypothetical protein EHI8A_045700 [Entamoeba histolytica HM-1:IMSS-B]EMS14572.1 hypothetical protein KM1_091100 [Entamoeba histolytica HM-3:IMSS]ENY63991.1 hypothetical protein EHI7A_045600 [Entamoeba histolytica HM-1:IMSS-A]GAT93869.1 hypothetical protein CL6EHI_093820 [Entamoeba histolytica]|eukprot:XP_657290.1 hypothetical protein EHI_093820 [Entamoeba histolytica HM-1:IMSS]
MEETRKRHLEDDIFLPTLKKRVVDIKVESVDSKSKTSEKPCVIEIGILPPASELEELSFSLKKGSDGVYKIRGSMGETLQYKQIEDRTDYMKYGIGIRKKGSTTIEIIPVEHFNLRHEISDAEVVHAEPGTYLEQRLDLNNSFGTSRHAINKVLRGRMEEVTGTHDIEREEVVPGEKEEKKDVLDPKDFPDIPPFDPVTTEASEIFALDTLMTPDEKTYYSNCARDVRNKLKAKDPVKINEVMNIIKTTKFGASFVPLLSQMEKVRLLTVVSLLELYRSLNVLFIKGAHIKSENIARKVASENWIDETVFVGLCDRFLDSINESESKKYIYSNLNKMLITNTAIVTALHICNFSISMGYVKTIGVDFLMVDIVTKRHLIRIGCIKESKANGGVRREECYTLKAPIKIVSEQKHKRASQKKVF